jgi:hypothetical protein
MGAEVDWKLYGTTQDQICFYDQAGRIFTFAKTIRVWIKCLDVKELEKFDISKKGNEKILDSTARLVSKKYVPPAASVTPQWDNMQVVNVTMYEVIATQAIFEKKASIYYELKCGDKMFRTLDFSATVNGKIISDHAEKAWEYIAPETNVARLHRLLCK